MMPGGLKKRTALCILLCFAAIFSVDFTGYTIHHSPAGIPVNFINPGACSLPDEADNCCTEESPVDHYLQHSAIFLCEEDENYRIKTYSCHCTFLCLHTAALPAMGTSVFQRAENVLAPEAPSCRNSTGRAPPAS